MCTDTPTLVTSRNNLAFLRYARRRSGLPKRHPSQPRLGHRRLGGDLGLKLLATFFGLPFKGFPLVDKDPLVCKAIPSFIEIFRRIAAGFIHRI